MVRALTPGRYRGPTVPRVPHHQPDCGPGWAGHEDELQPRQAAGAAQHWGGLAGEAGECPVLPQSGGRNLQGGAVPRSLGS